MYENTTTQERAKSVKIPRSLICILYKFSDARMSMRIWQKNSVLFPEQFRSFPHQVDHGKTLMVWKSFAQHTVPNNKEKSAKKNKVKYLII